jgi:hypothetical protein
MWRAKVKIEKHVKKNQNESISMMSLCVGLVKSYTFGLRGGRSGLMSPNNSEKQATIYVFFSLNGNLLRLHASHG